MINNLELRAALELRDINLIDYIFPIMIGDLVDDNYLNYFQSGCHPKLENIYNGYLNSIENQLIYHMDRLSLGSPMKRNLPIYDIISDVIKNQGGFVEGFIDIAYENVKKAIDSMFRIEIETSSNFLTSPRSGSFGLRAAKDALKQNILEKEKEIKLLEQELVSMKVKYENEIKLKDTEIFELKQNINKQQK